MSDATAFTDYKAKKALAGRGKTAEGAVKKYCERLAERRGVAFHWERIPDAHAAGGRFTPVAGDFRVTYAGRYGILEVKEVQSAERLPKKNYSRDAVARLYRHSLAGAVTAVLVHHAPIGVWAVVPIQHFFDNDVPSWLTTAFPRFESAEYALDFALKDLFNA
jgi:hypothetical protein